MCGSIVELLVVGAATCSRRRRWYSIAGDVYAAWCLLLGSLLDLGALIRSG